MNKENNKWNVMKLINRLVN